jgi:hypothetical protein
MRTYSDEDEENWSSDSIKFILRINYIRLKTFIINVSLYEKVTCNM